MVRKSPIRLIVEPLAIAITLAMIVRGACRIYSIPTASMTPTLEAGDHIIVTPYSFFHQRPARGDVIVFRSPLNRSELLVKRVVGLPGDLIESRGGKLRIAAHTVAEPYLMNAVSTGTIPPLIVPSGTLFVMGDNRTNSFDSRQWGPLPRALVLGHARVVLWSSQHRGLMPGVQASIGSAAEQPESARLTVRRLFHQIH